MLPSHYYSYNTDMSIYGSLPSRDPIQLVVCKWCSRTVKDTAMLRHQGTLYYSIHFLVMHIYVIVIVNVIELHHSSTKDTPILLNKITHPHHSYKNAVVKEQKVDKKKKGSKGKGVSYKYLEFLNMSLYNRSSL